MVWIFWRVILQCCVDQSTVHFTCAFDVPLCVLSFYVLIYLFRKKVRFYNKVAIRISTVSSANATVSTEGNAKWNLCREFSWRLLHCLKNKMLMLFVLYRSHCTSYLRYCALRSLDSTLDLVVPYLYVSTLHSKAPIIGIHVHEVTAIEFKSSLWYSNIKHALFVPR